MWKSELLELVKQFIHPAWGITHFERIYELSIQLAEMANTDIDEDSLFAAAYLHDIGAFDPYSQKGKDHSEIAVIESEKILVSMDFPEEKIALVKDITAGMALLAVIFSAIIGIIIFFPYFKELVIKN